MKRSKFMKMILFGLPMATQIHKPFTLAKFTDKGIMNYISESGNLELVHGEPTWIKDNKWFEECLEELFAVEGEPE